MTSVGLPTVLFDGRCGFCAWSVGFAKRVVGSDARFLPYQSVDLGEYGLTEEQCAAAVQFIGPSGSVSAERAVGAILQTGTAPWRPVGRLITSAPVRPLAGAVYRLVAKHRGRFWSVQPPIT